MDFQALLSKDIQDYIRQNESADLPALALKPFPFDASLKNAVFDQIKSRQKAKVKIPDWYAADNVILPPPTLMEQCSSNATARYKASLVSGEGFVDLTAGAGIDCAAIAQNFLSVTAVDSDETAAGLLAHNLPQMTGKTVKAVCDTAENFIKAMPETDLVYLDPQRREGSTKRGLFRLEDLSPNIITIIPELLLKAKTIMMKASPVLDIDQAVEALGSVTDVVVVEYNGDCKEVLYLIQENAAETNIHAVRIDAEGTANSILSFTRTEEAESFCEIAEPETYIYEPSPALMKAGCFKTVAERFSLKKLHISTHLYTSGTFIEGFPGRTFTLESVCNVDRKELKKHLPEMKASLKIRNFPAAQEELKKRLNLKDGGTTQLFACTLSCGNHALLLCKKSI